MRERIVTHSLSPSARTPRAGSGEVLVSYYGDRFQKMGMVKAYLLETDDSLLLVDAGWPNKTEVLFKVVQESGHNPDDIPFTAPNLSHRKWNSSRSPR